MRGQPLCQRVGPKAILWLPQLGGDDEKQISMGTGLLESIKETFSHTRAKRWCRFTRRTKGAGRGTHFSAKTSVRDGRDKTQCKVLHV